MVSIKKFLFDTEFDDGAADPADEPPPPPEPTFSVAELESTRAAALAEGRKRGLGEAAASHDRIATDALAAIGGALAEMAEAHARALDEARRGAVAIAAAIAAKIAPEVARRGAADDIAALVADRLPDLLDEPRLAIRMRPEQLDLVKQRLEDVAAGCGFTGQLILLADDGLDEPDCRIEWADGGVEKLLARVAGEIDRTVARYLSTGGEATAAATDAAA